MEDILKKFNNSCDWYDCYSHRNQLLYQLVKDSYEQGMVLDKTQIHEKFYDFYLSKYLKHIRYNPNEQLLKLLLDKIFNIGNTHTIVRYILQLKDPIGELIILARENPNFITELVIGSRRMDHSSIKSYLLPIKNIINIQSLEDYIVNNIEKYNWYYHQYYDIITVFYILNLNFARIMDTVKIENISLYNKIIIDQV